MIVNINVPVPQGYKRTDIGIIPETWEVKTLGEATEIKRGKFTPRPRNNPIYYGGNIPFVQTGDVTNSKGRIIYYSQTLNELGLSVSIVFKKGTILMTIAANIGYTGILELDMACPDSLVAINGLQHTNNFFLNHYFIFQRQKIENLSTSGAQKNLNIGLLSNFQIPLPPLSEQQRIAQILSDTDALIQQLDALIAKKQAIKQGTMQELLRPKEGWEVKMLGEVAEVKKGQLITEKTKIVGTIPVIAGGKTPAYFHNQPNRLGKTITISGSGANAGYVSFHEYPIFASDCSTIQENKNYVIEYVFYFLQMKQQSIYKMQTGGAQPHIHPKDLNPIQIPFPPLSEQQHIAQILSGMDKELEQLEAKRAKYAAIKTGLMQSLLTGAVRV